MRRFRRFVTLFLRASTMRPTDLPTTVEELGGRVRQTWTVWHVSPHQRTEVGALLPELITAAHALVKGREGAERRAAYRVMAETYALAQQYAAHTTEAELYWLTVDRARMAAEEADDPVTLAIAAWIVGNGLRDSGGQMKRSVSPPMPQTLCVPIWRRDLTYFGVRTARCACTRP